MGEVIPCLGYWSHTINGSDFDCEYEHAGHFGCEDCVVNGGDMNPREPPEKDEEEV